MKKALITGSAGLIGSESVKFFIEKGYKIVGIDNNMRQYFFGKEASTEWNKRLLMEKFKKKYIHYNIDIRDDEAIKNVFKEHIFDIVIHTAAQPSHDWAAKEPLTDFTVNANGTLVLLENVRLYSPEATFIFTSTNKVYGDRPNTLPLGELASRYELHKNNEYFNGIDESMSIDDSKHSIFGASKVAADIMVQEYGRYFNLKTAVFRGGCLTGQAHSGTKLHGFLAYLAKCIATGTKYTIYGYKGKQVRDNIHSYDLVNMFWHFHQNPRVGEVYNAGGGRHSNISMIEGIKKIEDIFETKANIEYSDQAREGDHIWYISDVSKFKKHYPQWSYQYDIDKIIEEICFSGHFSQRSNGSSTLTFFARPAVETKKIHGNIFLVGHTSDAFGVVQAFRFNFSSLTTTLTSVEHNLIKTQGNVLSSIKDLLLNIWWFHTGRKKFNVFLGVNPLNAFSGLLLRLLGNKFILIYYADDYSPKRFSNPLFNWLYHKIDFMSSKFADFTWSSTPEIYEVRKKMGVASSRNILLRSGVIRTMKKNGPDSISPNHRYSLVIDGFLSNEELVLLVIKSVDALLTRFPKLRLKIIVGHLRKETLMHHIEIMSIEKYVQLIYNVPHQRIFSEYVNDGIGIALYDITAKRSLHRDPVEIKELLAAGLPIIASKGYKISEEIDGKKMGRTVNNTQEEITQAIAKLLQDEKQYQIFKENALAYTKKLSWKNTIEQALHESKMI